MSAILLILAVLPFVQTLQHDFINLDDEPYVSANERILKGLTWEGIQWSLKTLYLANWQPLTWLSHMVDCDLYRQANGSQWPGGHHLTNIVLHAASTVVMFVILRRMTGAVWRPALVASLFAVHPTHVESVAWIAERKDLLSTFFGLCSIWAYVCFTRAPSAWRYATILILFMLSLSAKSMWVTLPCVLLLLDIWPLRRLRVLDIGGEEPERSSSGHENSRPLVVSMKRALLEKIPLLVLSAAASVTTLLAQKLAGAMDAAVAVQVHHRIENAVVSYAMYLLKLVWPTNLAVYYPLPPARDDTQVAGCAIILMALTVIVIWQRRVRPWLIVGWMIFLGMLVPVIGLVQVGGQAMADRYLYMPATGIFIMVVWSIPLRGMARLAAFLIACVSILVCSFMTHIQTSYWRNTHTLFNHAISVTQDNVLAHMQLADAMTEEGDINGAIDHLQQAIALHPTFWIAHQNLALLLINTGRQLQAQEHLVAVMKIKPTAFSGHHLGLIYISQSRWVEAESALRQAMELDAANEYNSGEMLGSMLIQMSRFDEAADVLTEVLQIDERSVSALNSLGVVRLSQGRPRDAEPPLRRAVELDPGNWEVQGNYGRALLELGRYDEAIEFLSQTVQGHPERLYIRTNLARALVGIGKRDEAIEELRAVLAESPQFQPAWTLLREVSPPEQSP